MARIRSIKPGFITDEKIVHFSDSFALFYILLWTVCDDIGIFTLDGKALSIALGRWRVQEVMRWLCQLQERGMVVSCSQHNIGMVRSWSRHQSPKKVITNWKAIEIQWDNAPLDGKKDSWIGEDRKGRDRKGYTDVVNVRKKPPKKTASPTSPSEQVLVDKNTQSKVALRVNEVIAAYAEAFKERYKTNPPIGGKESGMLKRLTAEFGADRMITLIWNFLQMNDQWFLTKQHSVDVFASNLNKIVVKADTGVEMTKREIQNVEKNTEFENLIKGIEEGRI